MNFTRICGRRYIFNFEDLKPNRIPWISINQVNKLNGKGNRELSLNRLIERLQNSAMRNFLGSNYDIIRMYISKVSK